MTQVSLELGYLATLSSKPPARPATAKGKECFKVLSGKSPSAKIVPVTTPMTVDEEDRQERENRHSIEAKKVLHRH